jgi:hypothetical protein
VPKSFRIDDQKVKIILEKKGKKKKGSAKKLSDSQT